MCFVHHSTAEAIASIVNSQCTAREFPHGRELRMLHGIRAASKEVSALGVSLRDIAESSYIRGQARAARENVR